MSARPEGPYGGIGDEGGEHALQLLENLLAPKTPMPFASGETPRWDDTDQQGFHFLFGLQSDINCIDPSYDDTISTGEIIDPWHGIATALPFSEAERYWMLEAQRRHWRTHRQRDPEVPLTESIVSVETTVMSAGVRQVLRGRDLARRWAAWRREADEFSGQGGLTTALSMLNHIAYELVPDAFSRPGFSEQYPRVAEFDARAHTQSSP
jgi:hypothetical protein